MAGLLSNRPLVTELSPSMRGPPSIQLFGPGEEVRLRPLRIDLLGMWFEYGVLKARVEVFDRDSGHELMLNFNAKYEYSFEPNAFSKFVRKFLVQIFEHEVCELLFSNGQRIFDPHEPIVISVKVRI